MVSVWLNLFNTIKIITTKYLNTVKAKSGYGKKCNVQVKDKIFICEYPFDSFIDMLEITKFTHPVGSYFRFIQNISCLCQLAC